MMPVKAPRRLTTSVATAVLGLAVLTGCSGNTTPITPSEAIASSCLTVTRTQAKTQHLSPNSNHSLDWDIHNDTGGTVTINYSGSGSGNGTVTIVSVSGGNAIPAEGTGDATANFHVGASGTSGGLSATVTTSCGTVTFPIYVIFAN
jgi:hypothetical protein